MTKTRRMFLFGAVVLAIGALALPAFAQHGPGGGRHGLGAPPGDLPPGRAALGPAGLALREIDLSETQRTQIHELVRASQESELGNLMRQHVEDRQSLEQSIWAAEPDEAAIVELEGRLSDQLRQIVTLRRALATQVLAVLDDAQRSEFRAALAEVDEMDRPRLHRRGPGPGR